MRKTKMRHTNKGRSTPIQRGAPATEADIQKVFQKAKNIAGSLCEDEGLELVHIEYQREQGGRTLRVYVDKPGGVTLDDCVRVNRQLRDTMDVCLEHEWSYNLEVSSPGPDRPLGKAADFERFKGELAKIRICEPIRGQKNFRGILGGLSDGMVNLQSTERNITIPYAKITRARLINFNGENECLSQKSNES